MRFHGAKCEMTVIVDPVLSEVMAVAEDVEAGMNVRTMSRSHRGFCPKTEQGDLYPDKH